MAVSAAKTMSEGMRTAPHCPFEREFIGCLEKVYCLGSHSEDRKISPILPLRLPGQKFAERAASCRCAPEAVALRPRDLDEVRMERRPAAHVGDAVVGEDVDAVAAGMEAMPPDALDHRDARPRGVGDARG